MKKEIKKQIKEIMRKIFFLRQIQAVLKTLKKLKVELQVRRICEREGLREDESDLLCAVIECESGFDTKAINKNRDESEDWGICQYNSYWYVHKMNLLSRKQCFNDTEKCIEVMIARYRKGFLKDWVCYNTNIYKKFLK